jgi:hypothetical protein
MLYFLTLIHKSIRNFNYVQQLTLRSEKHRRFKIDDFI